MTTYSDKKYFDKKRLDKVCDLMRVELYKSPVRFNVDLDVTDEVMNREVIISIGWDLDDYGNAIGASEFEFHGCATGFFKFVRRVDTEYKHSKNGEIPTITYYYTVPSDLKVWEGFSAYVVQQIDPVRNRIQMVYNSTEDVALKRYLQQRYGCTEEEEEEIITI